jgi:hypothetical protein
MINNYDNHNKGDQIMKIYFCGGKKCCPSFEIKGKNVTISDDYGNIIKITKSQLKELKKELVNLKI